MEQKEVEVNGKKFIIKELKYKDLAGLGEISQEESVKKSMMLSTNMTEEQYDELSVKEGVELQQAINEMNGLQDFQKPLTK